MERTFFDNRGTPTGPVLAIDNRACGAQRRSETSRPMSGRLVCTTEHEPACEVNEKGTREKNDGNEDVSMHDSEKIEVDSDEGSFVEEDSNDPEQKEVPKWTEPDHPMNTWTRKGDRKWTIMRYNRYGDDFLIDKIHTMR